MKTARHISAGDSSPVYRSELHAILTVCAVSSPFLQGFLIIGVCVSHHVTCLSMAPWLLGGLVVSLMPDK